MAPLLQDFIFDVFQILVCQRRHREMSRMTRFWLCVTRVEQQSQAALQKASRTLQRLRRDVEVLSASRPHNDMRASGVIGRDSGWSGGIGRCQQRGLGDYIHRNFSLLQPDQVFRWRHRGLGGLHPPDQRGGRRWLDGILHFRCRPHRKR